MNSVTALGGAGIALALSALITNALIVSALVKRERAEARRSTDEVV